MENANVRSATQCSKMKRKKARLPLVEAVLAHSIDSTPTVMDTLSLTYHSPTER